MRFSGKISIIILLFESFPHQLTLMVLHWSLSVSKSPRVFRTLLSILANLSNAVVWMVSIRPLISKSSSSSNNPSVTVPSAPIAISITVTFMFHISSIPKQDHGIFPSFRFLSLLLFLLIFFHLLLFLSLLLAKSTILQVLFFDAGYYKVLSSGRY